jgi:uncharacterized protein (TIGR03905 family)
MKTFHYQTKGVCSSEIIIEVDGDVIQSVDIIGGCPGNTMGVSKLCVGKSLDEVISLLEGIDCRGRGTSCPDQLAIACKKLKEELAICK